MQQEQKSFLLNNLSTYDDVKKSQLFDILKMEQDKKHNLNDRRLSEKKEYESKRNGIIRQYTERKSTESDIVELEDLEAQLQSA